MKSKFISLLITSILITSCLTTSVYAKSIKDFNTSPQTVTKYEVQKESVNRIINDYFEWMYKKLTKDTSVNLDNIIENKELINFKNEKLTKCKNEKLIEKTLYINEDIKNINQISNEYKSNLKNVNESTSHRQKRSCSSYVGQYAASYAERYAENYNPAYSNYDGEGGDCTNFVSQCLLAGGLPTDGTWYKDSGAWIRVTELRDWLTRKGYARELTWQGNTTLGDVVQLKNSSGAWSHSVIVTFNKTGRLFVSSHSGNILNKPLDEYNRTKRYLILTS